MCKDLFDDDEEISSYLNMLGVWVGREVLGNKALKGAEWVSVSIVKPSTTQAPLDAHQHQRFKNVQESEAGRPDSKVVARLLKWEDAPDMHHAALSSALFFFIIGVGI